MPLQFRRGTDSDRLSITPAAGEPLFTTDTKKLFIGDGSTAGGVNASAVDSGGVSSLVDSAYVLARAPAQTTADFPDSAGVNTLFDTRLGTKSTTNLSEGTNLYFTTARADSDAKNAISVTDAGGDGSMTYNAATGVITYTGPSAAEVQAHITPGEGIDISSGVVSGEDATTTNKGIASFATADFSVSSGAVSIKAGGVSNSQLANSSITINSNAGALGGSVTLDTDDISEGGSNLYFTNTRARGAFTGGTGVTYTSGSGNFAIGQAVGTGDSVSFAGLTVSGNTLVAGNLTVTGSTTTVNSTTLDVADKNITVAKGAANATAANGAGLTVDGANATLLYHSTGDKFAFNKSVDMQGATFASGTTVTFTGATVVGLSAGADSVAVQGIVDSNLTSGRNIAGTLTTAAQPNITSLGTLTGLTTTGNIVMGDNDELQLGAGGDLTMMHDGSHSEIRNRTGQLYIRANEIFLRNNDNNATYLTGTNGGSTELYYSNNKKLETTSGGVTVTGTVTATSFSGSGASLTGITADLVNDTSPQLGGDLATNGNNIAVADGDLIRVGTGNDLEIYHQSNVSYLKSTNTAAPIRLQAPAGEIMGDFIPNAGVELYHNGTKKFETTSAGVTISGDLDLSGNVDGRDIATDGTKLDGIATGATANTITNPSNDRILTSTGGGNANAEADFQFDGTNLFIPAEIRHIGDPDTKFGFDTDTIRLTAGGNIQTTITSTGTDVGTLNIDTLAIENPSSHHTYTTTVATKTAAHPYTGSGSSSAYFLDGKESPSLVLAPNMTYRFDQADNTNNGHPLRFYLDAAKATQYTTGVTSSGTPGSSGAYTQIVVTDATPAVLYYQCSSHAYMGSVASMLTGYSDAKVDTHLNTSAASSSQVLSWNGSDYAWVAQSGGGVDSASTTALITSTVDSNYVANRVGTASFTPKPKYARLTLTSDQNLGSGSATSTITNYNTRAIDTSTGNALTSTLGNGKFIIPAGVSKIKLRASLEFSGTTDQVVMKFLKNGSNLPGSTNFEIQSSGGDYPAAFTGIIDVAQNDELQVQIYHQSGTAIAEIDANFSWFELEVVEGSMLTDFSNIALADLNNVASTSPSSGQVLKWNGSAWAPAADGGGGGGLDSAATTSVARAGISVTTASASGGGSLSYNNSTGVLTFAPSTNSGGGGGGGGPSLSSFEYSATQGQTVFSGNDLDGSALAFDANQTAVFLNGVLLKHTNDYIESAGQNRITLNSGADSDDILTVQVFGGGGSGGVDSAATITLINSTIPGTVDSAYVQARQSSVSASNLDVSSNTITQFEFTADSAQTVFTGNDANGDALTFSGNDIIVHVNGVMIKETVDYIESASNNRITLTSSADSADLVTITKFTGGAIPHKSGGLFYTFVASAGQTSFSGADASGTLMSFIANQIQVHLNGIMLKETDDYTVNGTTGITLTQAAAVNDILQVSSFATIGGGVQKTENVATAGQTVFAGRHDAQNALVFVNGVLMADSDFTANGGGQISLTDSASAGDIVQVVNIQGLANTDIGVNWQGVKTSAYTLKVGEGVFVNSTSAAVTITLPASPNSGNEVRIIDAYGTSASNNITVNRNGSKIEGAASNLTIDVNRAAIGLVYVDNTQGWVLTEK